MSDTTLTKTRIRAGIWEGVLTGVPTRRRWMCCILNSRSRASPSRAIADRPGEFAVQVPIPAELLSEGVQTFLIRNRGTGQTLAHFTVITGVAMEDDVRAEIDLSARRTGHAEARVPPPLP